MITGGLTFLADCSVLGFFSFSCVFFLFHAIMLLFHGSVILPLCYFSSVSALKCSLILCHRKLAHVVVDPLSIYAFIFSPHASLKYLIPLSFFSPIPSCSNHLFLKFQTDSLHATWAWLDALLMRLKHWSNTSSDAAAYLSCSIWFLEDKFASLQLQPVHAPQGTNHLYSSSFSWDSMFG